MLQPTNLAEIHFAPLQGFTDKAYRCAFKKNFEGVDFYYSPYISTDANLNIDSLNDIKGFEPQLVPQILPGSFSEFLTLFNAIKPLGFQKINLNMGCPYPMVTRKGRGAALIRNPQLVNEIIDYLANYAELKLSLKIRSGLEVNTEIYGLLEKLNLEDVEEIIIHPRTAVQLYKGDADVEVAKKCVELFPTVSFIYNGDVRSYNDYLDKKKKLGNQQRWMLGRGLLQNPFLAWQIKNDQLQLPKENGTVLVQFIEEIIYQITIDSKNQGHALNRCKCQIDFLLDGFPEFHKIKKKVEKCRGMEELNSIIQLINY